MHQLQCLLLWLHNQLDNIFLLQQLYSWLLLPSGLHERHCCGMYPRAIQPCRRQQLHQLQCRLLWFYTPSKFIDVHRQLFRWLLLPSRFHQLHCRGVFRRAVQHNWCEWLHAVPWWLLWFHGPFNDSDVHRHLYRWLLLPSRFHQLHCCDVCRGAIQPRCCE